MNKANKVLGTIKRSVGIVNTKDFSMLDDRILRIVKKSDSRFSPWPFIQVRCVVSNVKNMTDCLAMVVKSCIK